MGLVPVTCPSCHSAQGITGGKTETGTQRDRYQQQDVDPDADLPEEAPDWR
jgi:hypothetical protein